MEAPTERLWRSVGELGSRKFRGAEAPAQRRLEQAVLAASAPSVSAHPRLQTFGPPKPPPNASHSVGANIVAVLRA
ncbi:MAG: hypothetical protein ICCCNLDF_00723 [Planctomycetes bacterium]|nr:hypothetical protein [Planctomycetota bacterium]